MDRYSVANPHRSSTSNSHPKTTIPVVNAVVCCWSLRPCKTRKHTDKNTKLQDHNRYKKHCIVHTAKTDRLFIIHIFPKESKSSQVNAKGQEAALVHESYPMWTYASVSAVVQPKSGEHWALRSRCPDPLLRWSWISSWLGYSHQNQPCAWKLGHVLRQASSPDRRAWSEEENLSSGRWSEHADA